jgi:hypothetical protein
MGKVDQHPETIHLIHDFTTERGEPTVSRLLGLEVAQLVDAVVDELNGAHARLVSLGHAGDVALEEVAALAGEQHTELLGLFSRLDVAGFKDDAHPRASGQFEEAAQLSLVILVGLVGRELADGGHTGLGGSEDTHVGDGRETRDAHTARLQRSERALDVGTARRVIAAEAVQEAATGVGVEIDARGARYSTQKLTTSNSWPAASCT